MIRPAAPGSSQTGRQARELGALPLHLLAEPVEPDDEHRARRRGGRAGDGACRSEPERPSGPPGAECRGPVEELDGIGDQIGRHEGAHRCAPVFQTIEAHTHETLVVRTWPELEGALDDYPEPAIAADQKPPE